MDLLELYWMYSAVLLSALCAPLCCAPLYCICTVLCWICCSSCAPFISISHGLARGSAAFQSPPKAFPLCTTVDGPATFKRLEINFRLWVCTSPLRIRRSIVRMAGDRPCPTVQVRCRYVSWRMEAGCRALGRCRGRRRDLKGFFDGISAER